MSYRELHKAHVITPWGGGKDLVMAKRPAPKREKPQVDWTELPQRFMREGISLTLHFTEPPTQLRDGTWHHTATVMSQSTHSDLDRLIGWAVHGKTVQGLERVATVSQAGKLIGLIMSERAW